MSYEQFTLMVRLLGYTIIKDTTVQYLFCFRHEGLNFTTHAYAPFKKGDRWVCLDSECNEVPYKTVIEELTERVNYAKSKSKKEN